MTLSIFASNCFVVLALMLTGQQMKDHLSIEFPVLEMEVKTRFGDDKALDVKALEEKLSLRVNKKPTYLIIMSQYCNCGKVQRQI